MEYLVGHGIDSFPLLDSESSPELRRRRRRYRPPPPEPRSLSLAHVPVSAVVADNGQEKSEQSEIDNAENHGSNSHPVGSLALVGPRPRNPAKHDGQRPQDDVEEKHADDATDESGHRPSIRGPTGRGRRGCVCARCCLLRTSFRRPPPVTRRRRSENNDEQVPDLSALRTSPCASCHEAARVVFRDCWDGRRQS